MPDQKPGPSKEQQVLEPRRGFTLFDGLHLSFTLGAALLVGAIAGRRFGSLLGLTAFVITGAVSFLAFGYSIGALVLFLQRRYSPQPRIGYEAACYVLSHFKRRS
jgi:hypothetical protein